MGRGAGPGARGVVSPCFWESQPFVSLTWGTEGIFYVCAGGHVCVGEPLCAGGMCIQVCRCV